MATRRLTQTPPNLEVVSHGGAISSVDADTGTTNKRPNTSPEYLFRLFVALNFVTFLDRGIIPGASREFTAFAAGATDSPPLVRASPHVGIGLLQAAFVGGYAVAVVIAGHRVHVAPWKRLVMVGLATWIVSVCASGLSYGLNSFYCLLFARMLSGVSEAAFQVVAPPMIQDRAGKHVGLWLATYLTAMPVGVGLGFIFGSVIANSIGWQWAFYLEAILAIPLFVALALVRDDVNNGILAVVDEEETIRPSDPQEGEVPMVGKHESLVIPRKSKNTLWEEIRVCLSSNVLVCIVLAYSAYVAVISTMGTFGGAFILALELFGDSEQRGALLFGCAAALAGVIGTPLGGQFVDGIIKRRGEGTPPSQLLLSILPYVNLGIIIGAVIIWPTVFLQSPGAFLGFLFVGWIFLFATQSGITMCTMLSVDRAHRPNAIAFTTLMIHLIGDVPAPIAFGALMDHLAPACAITERGKLVNLDECRGQHGGIRMSLAIAYGWLGWTVLFFEVARCLARRRVTRERDLGGGWIGGGKGGSADVQNLVAYADKLFLPPEEDIEMKSGGDDKALIEKGQFS